MTYSIAKNKGWKGQGAKKYPCNGEWLSLKEVLERTGLTNSVFFKRFKFQTVDQIVKSLKGK